MLAWALFLYQRLQLLLDSPPCSITIHWDPGTAPRFCPLRPRLSFSLLLIPGCFISPLLLLLTPPTLLQTITLISYLQLPSLNEFSVPCWASGWCWVVCSFCEGAKCIGWMQWAWVIVMELDGPYVLRTNFVQLHREFAGGNNWQGIFLLCA